MGMRYITRTGSKALDLLIQPDEGRLDRGIPRGLGRLSRVMIVGAVVWKARLLGQGHDATVSRGGGEALWWEEGIVAVSGVRVRYWGSRDGSSVRTGVKGGRVFVIELLLLYRGLSLVVSVRSILLLRLALFLFRFLVIDGRVLVVCGNSDLSSLFIERCPELQRHTESYNPGKLYRTDLGSLSDWLSPLRIPLHSRQNLIRQDLVDLGKVFIDILPNAN
jgi:hypothetical protein